MQTGQDPDERVGGLEEMCTLHAVVVLCLCGWQGLANRSMRIQDLYVGPVSIPRFIKEYSYSLFGVYVVWFSILILVSCISLVYLCVVSL